MTIADRNLLLFQIGPVACCVDSNTVQIVIEPPAHITAIPGSNAYRPGLMVYAKRAVSVYDVRTKFSLSTAQRGKIILTEIDNKLYGFWVDRIQSIILSSKGKWQILPVECPKDLFDGIFMYKEQLLFKTSFSALAKAQVSTQTQRFINKLLSEEKSQKNAATIKDDLSTKVSKENPDKKTATLATTTTASSSTLTGKRPAVEKTQLIKHDINKPEKQLKNKLVEKNRGPHIASKQPTLSYAQKIKPTLSSNSKKTTRSITMQAPRHVVNVAESVIKTSKASIKPTTLETSKTTKENAVKTPTRSSSRIKDSRYTEQPTPSSVGLFLLPIIIAIGGLSGYLFFNSQAAIPTQQINSKNSQYYLKQQNTATKEERFSSFLNTDSVKENNNQELSFNNTEKKIPLENNTINDQPAFNKAAIEENDKTDTDIVILDDTIIITINNFDAKFNNNILKEAQSQWPLITIDENESKDTSDLQNTTQPETTAPSDRSEKTKTPKTAFKANSAVKISTHKITHIIVKGDTLWHIAKRYINDPLKYPQLAKLSKIKNPDLIYPGNKIIIIIKNHKAD